MASNDLVVIQDYESNLKIIDQIIQRLDVQPVQVLIEAVIISVELDLDKQLGVNFAVVDNLDVRFVTRPAVITDLDCPGSLWEIVSPGLKIAPRSQEHGCSSCRCLTRRWFA